jgi:hypothetical protein
MLLDGTMIRDWTDGGGAPPAPTSTHWRGRHGGPHDDGNLDVNEFDVNTFDVSKFSILFWIFVLFVL